jgi:hypothetical protein
MPHEPLPPDRDALEQWAKLPQGERSRQAMPPLMSGSRALWGWMLLTGVVAVLVFLFGRG